jgi:3-hydroxyacyl-CoA dehydrogenase
MKRMIAAGRLGKKSGHGFYDYVPPPTAVLPTDETLKILEIAAASPRP